MRIARGISVTNTSRPVGISYDADAVAFFTAASITDNTQKSAVNTLVLDLKAASIWTKMKALYPVVGGVASSHAINLKQPGTYNLTFATGWTHASTGMTPNGATYANTFLTPSIDMAGKQNNMSICAYIRTNNNGNYVDIGTSEAGYLSMSILMPRTSDLFNGGINNNANSNTPNTDSRGLFIIKRTSSTVVGYQKNNTLTNKSNTSSGLSNASFYIGAMHEGTNNVSNSINQCAFASIGDGLTDTDATNFYNAVQNYQTTLGRQV